MKYSLKPFAISLGVSTNVEHFHLRSIGTIWNLITFDGIQVLITTRLDFCNSILYNIPNNKIERLQRIQNQVAHMLKRIPRRNHITPEVKQ